MTERNYVNNRCLILIISKLFLFWDDLLKFGTPFTFSKLFSSHINTEPFDDNMLNAFLFCMNVRDSLSSKRIFSFNVLRSLPKVGVLSKVI